MPRKYRKVLGGRSYQNYNQDNLKKAIEEVKNRTKSLRKASEFYGVPKSTISNGVNEKHTKKAGGQSVLNVVEENRLVLLIQSACEWGFPLTEYDIREIVKQYLNRKGVNIEKFHDNMPGRDWTKSFLSRHKELTVRLSQNIKRLRAQVSVQTITEYFTELEKALENIDAANIVNYDETNFSDDTGKAKVVCKRGVKHCDRIMDSTKTSISVMMSASANGELLPPFVVYKAKHRYQEWEENGPPGCEYSISKSGWFEAATFYEWFSKILLPYFRNKEGTKLLIGDNLSSHLTIKVIEECHKNDIKFILLPPNSTHLCQPLDVSFFGPLKKGWRKILTEWKYQRKGAFQKSDFPQLLQRTLQFIQAKSEANILSGFRGCGIVPFNPQEVIKRLPNHMRSDEETGTTMLDQSLLDFLKENRNPQENNKKGKRKRINVPPGREISKEDINAALARPSTSGCQKTTKSSQSIAFESDPSCDSDSESMPLKTLIQSQKKAKTTETAELQVNEFGIIAIPVNNSTKKKYYVGKIISKQGNHIHVKFLRKKNTGEGCVFVFPIIDDESDIVAEDIFQKLIILEQRRDRYTFENLPMNINIE